MNDVRLAEYAASIRHGKGGKRREVPVRRDLAQMLWFQIGTRRARALFAKRQ